MRSWEISGLDINPGSNHPTLRQTLNVLESNIEPSAQIFHSVDDSFQQGAVVFTFHPAREEEARAMVSTLIPFLKWAVLINKESFPNSEKNAILARRVYKHFTQEAMERAEGAVWIDALNTVETPQDKEILDLDDMDKEFHMGDYIVNVDTDDLTLESLDR
jgi:hypothetical protein